MKGPQHEANFCPCLTGHEIDNRVEAHWLYTSPAMFVLLRAAVLNPLNRYFVLLSEACLPLYPAAAVYLQIIHDPRSRINRARPCFVDYQVPSHWSES